MGCAKGRRDSGRDRIRVGTGSAMDVHGWDVFTREGIGGVGDKQTCLEDEVSKSRMDCDGGDGR